jgi:hypothetical protein
VPFLLVAQTDVCASDGKVLPFRQVSDVDSCRRMNSAVMKIRLFKPKTSSKTEISIAVEALNLSLHLCLKGRIIIAVKKTE